MSGRKAIQLIANDGAFALSIKVNRVNGLITGGMQIGDVTYQNQALLLMAQKGEFKEHPRVGAGLSDIVNDENLLAWKAEIISQLEDDGQRVNKLELDSSGLTLDAQYR